MRKFTLLRLIGILLLILSTSACQPNPAPPTIITPMAIIATPAAALTATPLYTPRPHYTPGELVDYVAQDGDTLGALAARFNTTVDEIIQANTFIPANATTLPPGMPMKIPIYYAPFWGSAYQIIPDGLFVNGPAQVGFDTAQFVAATPGWLSRYSEYAADQTRSGAQIVDYIAQSYSVSPRLLLALLEYQTGALTQYTLPEERQEYPLGYEDWGHKGLYMQLSWAANALNNGYYGWRIGQLTALDHPDGRLERPDPWQNAATVGLQHYFLKLLPEDAYQNAIAPTGLASTYAALFGDPWANRQTLIPGSLVQPALTLPFPAGETWSFTGGPHTAWGLNDPLAALDFSPPALTSGCTTTTKWATAMAAGVVARSETGLVMLDLDDGDTPADGDERTGWVIFYFHIGTDGRARAGTRLQTGQPIGHPSCEGGRTTGTHIHLARKYNGEWIPADGPLAFNLDGWLAQNGSEAYQGSMVRYSQVVIASEHGATSSHVGVEAPKETPSGP